MKRGRQFLIAVVLITAFLGFADAVYLTVSFVRDVPPACTVSQGCGEVMRSEYASIGLLPVSLLGVFYYVALVFLTLLYLETKTLFWLQAAFGIAALGLVFSGWLTYLQLAVIKSLCQYCLASAVFSLVLTGFLAWLLRLEGAGHSSQVTKSAV
jgi:uncharacterized membrane protein